MKFSVKRLAVCSVIGYLLLLVLLTFAESGNPDSSINSFTDALWYSVVTLSTVGYGDMYPLTPLGRIIGVCFVLMSLGVLSFIMGTIINFLTGRLLPALKLMTVQNRPWYVFDHADEISLTLAKDLEQRNPDAIFLFPLSQQECVERKSNYRFYPGTIAQAIQNKDEDCNLFFLAPDRNNYSPALEALSLGHPVYCRSRQVPVDRPNDLTLFNRYSCCARGYWRSFPINKNEQNVILIGNGEYAEQLLEQGVLVNVFSADRRIRYHMFGDWSNFRRNHPKLDITLSVDCDAPLKDCLFFHSEPWNHDAELLCKADRIILCDDRDSENLEILHRLRRYFPIGGALHLRAASDIPGEVMFGTNETIYTADLVMGTQLTETARLMHQIYADGADAPVPVWEELSDFTQQSNIAAADHLLTKVRILLQDDSITALTKDVCLAAYEEYRKTHQQLAEQYRELEHLRWMRFHSLYNWAYAPTRDNAARLHPLMQSYHTLSPEEQAKDDYAWELIGKIANRL